MKTKYQFQTIDFQTLVDDIKHAISSGAIDLNGIPENSELDKFIEIVRSITTEKISYADVSIEVRA